MFDSPLSLFFYATLKQTQKGIVHLKQKIDYGIV